MFFNVEICILFKKKYLSKSFLMSRSLILNQKYTANYKIGLVDITKYPLKVWSY